MFSFCLYKRVRCLAHFKECLFIQRMVGPLTAGSGMKEVFLWTKHIVANINVFRSINTDSNYIGIFLSSEPSVYILLSLPYIPLIKKQCVLPASGSRRWYIPGYFRIRVTKHIPSQFVSV